MRVSSRLAARALVLLAASVAVCCGRADRGELRHTNRLIGEKSPYLQQHAHNPVDWYPWGAEAFERARREGKMIFLSVGYSTCHWCHVMEAESFSNPAIAAYLNAHYVSIKVDREERPDLDRIYQNYVIGVSEGGWPMSLFLTPDLQPLFGANYLPPDDRDGEPGLRTLLARMTTLWNTDRPRALRAAAEGTQALEARSRATAGDVTTLRVPELLDETYAGISATFDPASGGFGGAPRFPRPVVLTFLLRYYARTGARPALDMTLETLRGMARGGIHDRLGGGFHRYATDRAWHVPHFEKMLYDQAQLAMAYVDAYQASRDPFFRDVARGVLAYVLRDMRDPEGGFHAAEDADSKRSPDDARGVEGAFYVWTLDEVRRATGRHAPLVAYHYGIEPGGNVPPAQDELGELKGRNVLSERHSVAETAAHFGRSEADVRAALDAARRMLAASRELRPRPPRDDKVLVAWNGLMMSALSRAAQAFADTEYLDAARTQAHFIERRMYDTASGTLARRYLHGHVEVDAVLEDYALLVQGLLDLFEASFDPRWLSWAVQLQQTQDRLFWDQEGGAYFSTRAGAEGVLVRAKEEYDGTEPSANSVAAMNLLRLWRLTTQRVWRDRADATFRALSPRLVRSGASLPLMLAALTYDRSRSKEIVIVGDPASPDTHALVRLVHDRFLPHKVVVATDGGAGQRALQPLVPFVDGMRAREGRATIYVCENYACRLPTADPEAAARLLDDSETEAGP
jgi:uncharacterized protein YyaL (SSP411 family)